MIDEAIASAELAQPAWTYPICIACGAPVLAANQLDSTSRGIHWICPDVEDLDSLPLVERAAIACSMCACDGYEFTDNAPIVTHHDAAHVVGDDVHDLVETAMYQVLESGSLAFAAADAMLRNGDVTP